MKLIIILLLLVLPACAPMPGGKFLPGITHATELKDIPELVVHDCNIFQSTAMCNWLLLKQGSILPILAVGGIIACADVQIDTKGGVWRCEVWAPTDYMMKHELLHCNGWADKWY